MSKDKWSKPEVETVKNPGAKTPDPPPPDNGNDDADSDNDG